MERKEFWIRLALIALFIIPFVVVFPLKVSYSVKQAVAIFEMFAYLQVGMFVYRINPKFIWIKIFAIPIIVLEHYFFPTFPDGPLLNFLLPVGMAIVTYLLGVFIQFGIDKFDRRKEHEKEISNSNNNYTNNLCSN